MSEDAAKTRLTENTVKIKYNFWEALIKPNLFYFLIVE